MDYPKTLYVNERETGYFRGVKQLVGSGYLDNMVNEQETEIATYQLVSVETYKKTVKVECTVKKVAKEAQHV